MIIECDGHSYEFDDKDFDAWAEGCRRLNIVRW